MEPTGRGLVDFWAFAAEKGLMNANTAGSLRSACKEVLTALEGEDWEGINVRTLSVDDAVQRFERLRMNKFKPSSLSVYKSRFKNAVMMFLAYLDDPSGWRYTAERPARERKKQTERGQEFKDGTREAMRVADLPANVQLIEYPFPLRPNVIVTLQLPADMTHREAERLGTYLKSLAYEAPKELMPAVTMVPEGAEAS